jgi:50S ribosomal subunit-associated GTPase HflX
VIDSSAVNANEQREAVLQVLEDIGTPKQKLENCLIEVWNKSDLAGGGQEMSRDVNPEGQISHGDLPPSGQISSQEEMLIIDANHEQSVMQEVHVRESIPREGTEILGLEWSYEGVSCVATSARTRMGLKELCHLLDRKLPRKVEQETDFQLEESILEK